LFVAASSSSIEEPPGGLWAFEVPMLNGTIDFAPASGLSVGTPAFTSTPACLTTPTASTETTTLPIGLSSTSVQVTRVTPQTHEQ